MPYLWDEEPRVALDVGLDPRNRIICLCGEIRGKPAREIEWKFGDFTEIHILEKVPTIGYIWGV